MRPKEGVEWNVPGTYRYSPPPGMLVVELDRAARADPQLDKRALLLPGLPISKLQLHAAQSNSQSGGRWLLVWLVLSMRVRTSNDSRSR